MELILKITGLLSIAIAVHAGLPHAPPLSPLSPPAQSAPLFAPQLQPQAANDYGFRYSVNDFKGNEHSHQQRRVGNSVTGQYKVLLPDGRLQTVTYVADENGYRAKVDYTPARPGEATTAGLGAPPIIAQQPVAPILPQSPPLRPPFPLGAAQRTSPVREAQDGLEREDAVESDAEEIADQIEYPYIDSPVMTERAARRLGSLDDSSRRAAAAPEPRTSKYGYNNRAGRIRFNNNAHSRSLQLDTIPQSSPYTISRYAY